MKMDIIITMIIINYNYKLDLIILLSSTKEKLDTRIKEDMHNVKSTRIIVSLINKTKCSRKQSLPTLHPC